VVLRRSSLIDGVMRSVTHLGDAWVVILVALVLALGGIPGWEATGYAAGFAVAASHLGVQLLKRTIDRARPRLPVGYASLIEAPDRFSFPSGHSAASLSLALPAAASLPLPLGGAVLSVALLVGISRCYLGVHYPGDVLMGWLLAGLATWAAAPAMAWLL
jgi:undecaprenyl-diphosphatase